MNILLTDKEIEQAIGFRITSPRTGFVLTLSQLQRNNQSQLRKVRQWGDEDCPHRAKSQVYIVKRRECRECWEQLRREAGLEG